MSSHRTSQFPLRAGSNLCLLPRTFEYISDVPYHQTKYERQIKSLRNHDFTLVTCSGKHPVELRQLEIEACLLSLFSLLVCLWRDSSQCARNSSLTSFLDHTQRRTTLGRTPLDE